MTNTSVPNFVVSQSLFNDGTALVIYQVVVKIVRGNYEDGLFEYFYNFVSMAFGGAIFGVLFGALIVFWLSFIFNDALSEITITMAAAYMCFFVAEDFLSMSGVIAVVCFGLYFGKFGKTRVSPEVSEFLEEFWELLAYFGNTLIFIIAGIVISHKIDKISGMNIVNVIVIYIFCAVIRAVTVGSVYCTMNYGFGCKLERNDQFVAIWGGLRGAVGLALALLVFNEFEDTCSPLGEQVLLMTAGIVVLTVCVNSTTMPFLVSALKMDRVTASRQMVFDQAMRQLRSAGDSQEALLRSDHVFDSAVWDEVRKYYFVVPQSKVIEEKVKVADKDKKLMEVKEARRRVLMICKKSYWKQFSDGLLSNHALKYLIHVTDLSIDTGCDLAEWEELCTLLKFNSSINIERQEEHNDTHAIDKKALARRKLLKTLDSIPVVCGILAIVVVMCVWTVTLGEGTDPVEYKVFEYVSTSVFVIELSIRLWCLGDVHSFMADPYTVMDAIVVFLDLALMGSEQLLGSFGQYSKVLRGIRIVRLIRFLRFARLAKKIRDTNIEAINDTKSLWGKSESFAKKYKRRILYSQLQHGYDVACGFKIAREEALDLLSSLLGSANRFRPIRDGIEGDLKKVRNSLIDMQRLYSEIAASITTTTAARTVLNKQRHAIHDLYHEGLLDKGEMERMIGSVEYQMKRLLNNPPVILMPEKAELLGQIPWLECLSRAELSKIVEHFEDAVFQRGDILMKQDDDDDSVYVLARGTVLIEYETQLGEKIQLEELGMGSVFGEIAWAMRSKRGASVIATSPGLLFRMNGEKLREIAQRNHDLSDRLWDTCGRRLSENMLANQVEHAHKSRRQIRDIVHNMELFGVQPDRKDLEFRTKAHVVLLQGNAFQFSQRTGENRIVEAPDMVRPMGNTGDFFSVKFSQNAKFMCEMSFVTTRKTLLKAKLKMKQEAAAQSSVVSDMENKINDINIGNALQHDFLQQASGVSDKFRHSGFDIKINNKQKSENDIKNLQDEASEHLKEAIAEAREKKKEYEMILKQGTGLQNIREGAPNSPPPMNNYRSVLDHAPKSPNSPSREKDPVDFELADFTNREDVTEDFLLKGKPLLEIVDQEEHGSESLRKTSLLSRRYKEPQMAKKYEVSPNDAS